MPGPRGTGRRAAPVALGRRDASRRGPYLIGKVSGHPRTADGWCATSVILAIDVRAGWVRTINRYYRLGPSLGQSLQ